MNIVIIGYGGMGAYHADRLKKIKDIDVIGAYDIDPARAALAPTNRPTPFSPIKRSMRFSSPRPTTYTPNT